jgi:hypothetical protein
MKKRWSDCVCSTQLEPPNFPGKNKPSWVVDRMFLRTRFLPQFEHQQQGIHWLLEEKKKKKEKKKLERRSLLLLATSMQFCKSCVRAGNMTHLLEAHCVPFQHIAIIATPPKRTRFVCFFNEQLTCVAFISVFGVMAFHLLGTQLLWRGVHCQPLHCALPAFSPQRAAPLQWYQCLLPSARAPCLE